ncbi:uncharacterized protein KIAA2013 homolog [Anabrus simplex]|uniref:uncharacterized protein KIAA2013 homolog n=1 Tax=Anabrus simplex TaxID=316456 RepID=UPI0035A285E9
MELLEVMRRWKRTLDNYFTYRRAFLLVTIVFGLIFYLGPDFIHWLTKSKPSVEDIAERCLQERLNSFYFDASEFNANVQHIPLKSDEKPYLPYVGNGIFGLSLSFNTPLYIKVGRTLGLPVPWHPIVQVNGDKTTIREAIVVHYLTGTAYRFQCFSSGLFISYQYYAHRTMPSILVQDVKITNPTSENLELELEQLPSTKWPTAVSHIVTFPHGTGDREYVVTTGMLDVPHQDGYVLAVSIVSKKVTSSIEVKGRSSTTLQFITAVNYSEPIEKEEYAVKKDIAEKQCMEKMRKALLKSRRHLQEDHVNVWQQLWSTGVFISYSKAANAINGDKINATMYYVLSQVTSPYYEEDTSKDRRTELGKSLVYAEGCYGGHHTLEADNLWSDLASVKEANKTAAYWLLTLEKQGCHNLLKAGASGIIQAIVLSIGSLRFSNQHLEFNIHPKYLHRDFSFRRVSYGNSTHVNISVVVQEDNKAVLFVALDRSDRYYYACDAGCLDPPTRLGPMKKQFPVKLTDPVTAILYITHDTQHMEDLRHAIHVKEVAEAPAHEHHVIALHKHGHHLGGLPALFWVSICVLIVLFHMFLFKLIYNEYCGSPEKYRNKYGNSEYHSPQEKYRSRYGKL